MDNAPREQLAYIISQCGPQVCNDAGRVEGLLRDLCGAHRREVNVLMSVLRERVPQDLMNAPAGVSTDMLLARLVSRVHDHHGISEEYARWGIESWILALGMSLPVLPAPRPAPRATIVPTTSNDDLIVDLSGGGTHTSLRDALAVAAPGALVHMRAGTYHLESGIFIQQPVTIIGAGMDKTILTADKGGYVLQKRSESIGLFCLRDLTVKWESSDPANVVSVEDGEVNLERCHFSGASSIGNGYMPVLSLGGTLTGWVADCVVDGNGVGIFVYGSASPVLHKNICRDTGSGIVYSGHASGIARGNTCSGNERSGISLQNEANPLLEANICTNNKLYMGITYYGNASGTARMNICSGNGHYGIWVTEQANPTLIGNICKENKQSGIVYSGSTSGKAKQNTCSDNTYHGIVVSEQATVTLEANICNGNKSRGIIYCGTTSGTATENTCSANAYHAIHVHEQATPILESNTCTGNTHGIVFGGSASGVARGNRCQANITFGIAVTEQAHPMLEANICSYNSNCGIAYTDNASGTARGNTCLGNTVFPIWVTGQAKPVLESNMVE